MPPSATPALSHWAIVDSPEALRQGCAFPGAVYGVGTSADAALADAGDIGARADWYCVRPVPCSAAAAEHIAARRYGCGTVRPLHRDPALTVGHYSVVLESESASLPLPLALEG